MADSGANATELRRNWQTLAPTPPTRGGMGRFRVDFGRRWPMPGRVPPKCRLAFSPERHVRARARLDAFKSGSVYRRRPEAREGKCGHKGNLPAASAAKFGPVPGRFPQTVATCVCPQDGLLHRGGGGAQPEVSSGGECNISGFSLGLHARASGRRWLKSTPAKLWDCARKPMFHRLSLLLLTRPNWLELQMCDDVDIDRVGASSATFGRLLSTLGAVWTELRRTWSTLRGHRPMSGEIGDVGGRFRPVLRSFRSHLFRAVVRPSCGFDRGRGGFDQVWPELGQNWASFGQLWACSVFGGRGRSQ